jgi:hypothetical protein
VGQARAQRQAPGSRAAAPFAILPPVPMLEAMEIHARISALGWPVWSAAADLSVAALVHPQAPILGDVVGSDYAFKLGVDDPVAGLQWLPPEPAVRRRLVVDHRRDLLRLPVAAPA